ncbi:RNA polymerase, sigma-24 subunit, ECF subfamily [Solidesulfovibrio fructosivorans JJ]]|uniref:RNA polymerase, sigma-24 subunit, ECF subfamily n=1 Tax=Solidesulfovibrio fructosivorans JJ] TaxID=596151 RepID=E1JTT4_SOLFR|nr:sigma-70 family RNA polymerase sigma factor [Solidesulfovibrio fructosivorans]EFL52213.1 RNA polymerase, sigma-24 subunit, ECF subfamily [Solidesulfovibrio fructosivorans JJ]]
MNHDDETQLIEDILDGEAAAYAVLVRRYQSPIHGLMSRMCRNPADASDLTQEAFVVAYEKLEKFKVGARFFPWLYTLSLNIARDHLRKQGRVEIPASALHDGFMENIQDETADDALIEKIDSEKLFAAMEALGLETREVLILRYQEGLSIQDIADALKISVSAVKMRISRGLERLRAMFVVPRGGQEA